MDITTMMLTLATLPCCFGLGYNFNPQVQKDSKMCNVTSVHTLTATNDLTTHVVTPAIGGGDNWRFIEEGGFLCDVYTLSPPPGDYVIRVMVSDVTLMPHDKLVVIADDTARKITMTYNTSNSDPDLWRNKVISGHVVTLLWVQDATWKAESRRLTFSIVGEREEHKERTVFYTGVALASFTMLATVYSVWRATKCSCVSRCFGKRKQTTPVNNGSSVYQENITQRETTVLMEVEVIRPSSNEATPLTPSPGTGRDPNATSPDFTDDLGRMTHHVRFIDPDSIGNSEIEIEMTAMAASEHHDNDSAYGDIPRNLSYASFASYNQLPPNSEHTNTTRRYTEPAQMLFGFTLNGAPIYRPPPYENERRGQYSDSVLSFSNNDSQSAASVSGGVVPPYSQTPPPAYSFLYPGSQ